jgi:hypothetical protein
MKLTIISDKGSPMMVITKIARKGNALEITGQLMGAWNSKMYITTEQFGGFLRATFSPGVITFVLLYPFFYILSKFRRKEKYSD